MQIIQIETNKKRFLPLLLLGDEQESMIDRYLNSGDMFVMFNDKNQAIATAVITVEDEKTIELKNLAVTVTEQGKGFGRQMLDFLCRHYGKISTHSLSEPVTYKALSVFISIAVFLFRIELKIFSWKTTIIRFSKMVYD